MGRGMIVMVLVVAALGAACSSTSAGEEADERLQDAMEELVAMPSGPPGVVVVVQRGGEPTVHTAGVADVSTGRPPEGDDQMRIASVAKAFSGAVALSLVDQGRLGLDDTVGQHRPDLPEAFHAVTVRQLLQHTSGVPDFIRTEGFVEAVTGNLDSPPPPDELLDPIDDLPLDFPSASQYAYSNSDNIIIGLIVEAVTGQPYADVLRELVYEPLDLEATSLPVGTEIADPALHGYDLDPPAPPEDVTHTLAAGWAWASGGIVSTPEDLNAFIRGYVGGELFDDEVQDAQRQFIPGAHSEPMGPGENSAGLALFRYETPCGTVYGHTGNTLGYTQFAAASPDGRRSATVAMNLQRTHGEEGYRLEVWKALRRVQELAVCAALAGR